MWSRRSRHQEGGYWSSLHWYSEEYSRSSVEKAMSLCLITRVQVGSGVVYARRSRIVTRRWPRRSRSSRVIISSISRIVSSIRGSSSSSRNMRENSRKCLIKVSITSITLQTHRTLVLLPTSIRYCMLIKRLKRKLNYWLTTTLDTSRTTKMLSMCTKYSCYQMTFLDFTSRHQIRMNSSWNINVMPGESILIKTTITKVLLLSSS